MVRMHADRAERVIFRGCNECAVRRMLPKGTAGGHDTVEMRYVGRRCVRKRNRDRRESQIQSTGQLLGEFLIIHG